MQMLVIGLTGGIGAGKSTVADLFAERGRVPIIDADIIAREVVAPHMPAYTAIVEHFGHHILSTDHTLDRIALRHIIFERPKERRWLENLLHPIIQETIAERIHTLSAPYCIAVIPLLFEVKSYPFIDRILVIDASPTTQMDRVAERDHAQPSQIHAILEAQAQREERLIKAHDVITNDGTLADLVPQVDRLHQMYLTLSK